MSTINTRLYPLADVNEHDVISLYSTLNTNVLAGTLVKIATGTANPQNTDGFSTTAAGGNYNTAGVFTFSNRYETKMKTLPTASGDTRYDALGLTQLSVLDTDANGLPLVMFPQRAKELGVVVSGETVPIVTKATLIGIWGKYIDQSTSPVQPGFLAVVSRSGNGTIASVDPKNATLFNTGSSSFIYTPAHVVGKWLTSLPTSSNTGIANEWTSQGGYALLQFNAQS